MTQYLKLSETIFQTPIQMRISLINHMVSGLCRPPMHPEEDIMGGSVFIFIGG